MTLKSRKAILEKRISRSKLAGKIDVISLNKVMDINKKINQLNENLSTFK